MQCWRCANATLDAILTCKYQLCKCVRNLRCVRAVAYRDYDGMCGLRCVYGVVPQRLQHPPPPAPHPLHVVDVWWTRQLMRILKKHIFLRCAQSHALGWAVHVFATLDRACNVLTINNMDDDYPLSSIRWHMV